MSGLKAGDKRKHNGSNGIVFEIIFVGENAVMCRNIESKSEYSYDIESLDLYSTPYQEPVPVKRIVAFELDGDIRFAFEGSEIAMRLAQYFKFKRIELSPEHFGWSK